jgi:BarA-like signal transduction histidine kinase
MSDPSSSETPLRTTFKIRLNGNTLAIATVGQAYQFLTNYNSVEWMEFRTLHEDAIAALEGAADNAMLAVPATNAVRALFVSAKLL